MREIKFRAWDKKRKRWTAIQEVVKVIGETPILYLFSDAKERIEIMQFTGLKDKNGKEIFEGDILQSYPIKDVRFIVGFGTNKDDNTYGFNLTSIKNFRNSNKNVYGFEVSVRKMEVIGNKFENPELLK